MTVPQATSALLSAVPSSPSGLSTAPGTYEVPGCYTAVTVVLRTALFALDVIRSGGERLGPVRVCHAHRLVHILVDAGQAAAFKGVPGALAATDNDIVDCGHHWGRHSAPYWIVPLGADAQRVDPAALRTILINHS
jgi:hypothetical protein